MELRRSNLEVAPLFLAVGVARLAVDATNRVGRMLGRVAQRRGMPPDDVALSWGLSLDAARALVDGEDFLRLDCSQ